MTAGVRLADFTILAATMKNARYVAGNLYHANADPSMFQTRMTDRGESTLRPGRTLTNKIGGCAGHTGGMKDAQMPYLSDQELFEHSESERSLALNMTNDELSKALLGVIGSIYAAESEFCVSDSDYEAFRKERGVVREAAYRLAKIRAYETC